MSHTDNTERLNRVIDAATETITTAQLTISDAQLTIRTTIAAAQLTISDAQLTIRTTIAALAAIAANSTTTTATTATTTTARTNPLGVTRAAFLWRVVDMIRKNARNTVLCKRRFTPDLLHKIKYQCRIVMRALANAVYKTKAFTQEVTGNLTHKGLSVDVEPADRTSFMLYLVGLGYESCLQIVQQADDHMPPHSYKHFWEFCGHYVMCCTFGGKSNKLCDIYMDGREKEYALEFPDEPRIGDSDYCEHVIVYHDHDTNNEIPDDEAFDSCESDYDGESHRDSDTD